MREFLKGLELEKETIDTIMSEHGKLVTEDKETINSLKSTVSELDGQVKTYETKVSELETNSKDGQKITKELEKLKASIAEKEELARKEAEEKTFSEELEKVIGDKKFINEYTKQAIINEFKTALQAEGNKDKEKQDVFTELTKDRMDLFNNPNKVEIPPTNEIDQSKNKTEIPLIW